MSDVSMKSYLRNLLISIDRVGNCLLGGHPDETMSARSGRLRYTHWAWRILAEILDCIQPFHDQLAIEHNILRDREDEAVLLAAQRHDDELIERTIEEQRRNT